MELEVLRTSGIPESGVISVRAGSTRRQGQLSAMDRPLTFPQNPQDCTTFKIDILDHLGTARLSVNVGPPKAEYRVKVEPLHEAPGRSPMEVAFAIRDLGNSTDNGKATSVSGESAGAMSFDRMDINKDGVITREEYDQVVHDTGRAVSKEEWEKNREVKARTYLEDHGLVTFMQFLMQALMKDKPSDPYTFIQTQVNLRIAQIRMAEQERGLEPSVTKVIEPVSAEVSLEKLAELERDAVEAGKNLRGDNDRLRGAAADLETEYQKLVEDSRRLQAAAGIVPSPSAGAEAPRPLAANLPPPHQSQDEANVEPLPGESPRMRAFREINLVQSDVSSLAKENAALINELSRMRRAIESVRGGMTTVACS